MWIRFSSARHQGSDAIFVRQFNTYAILAFLATIIHSVSKPSSRISGAGPYDAITTGPRWWIYNIRMWLNRCTSHITLHTMKWRRLTVNLRLPSVRNVFHISTMSGRSTDRNSFSVCVRSGSTERDLVALAEIIYAFHHSSMVQIRGRLLVKVTMKCWTYATLSLKGLSTSSAVGWPKLGFLSLA